MATNVSAGIKLSALVDGTTVQGRLLSTKPLHQAYNEANLNAAIPDFKEHPENRPTIYFVISDTSTGNVYNDSSIGGMEWYYNSQLLEFGPDGTSIDTAAGLFKKKTFDYNGVSVPALEVINNFPQFGHYDNDIISANACVDINGSPIWVKDISIDVTIEKKSGAIYSIQLDDQYGFQIPADDNINQTETTATLLIDGVVATTKRLQELAVSFVWEKMEGGTYVEISTGNKVTISKDDINNVLIVRCRAVKSEADTIASAYASYTDTSDTYFINFIKVLKGSNTALQGTTLRRGQIVFITPEILSRKSNQKYEGTVAWKFYAYDNNGSPCSNFTKNEAQGNCEVSYDNVVEAKMNMAIVADATI